MSGDPDPVHVDGVPVSKGRARFSLVKQIPDADTLRALDLTDSRFVVVGRKLFEKDNTDATVEDDDENVLEDFAGNKWLWVKGDRHYLSISATFNTTAGEILFIHEFRETVQYPADFEHSNGIALTVATGSPVFSIKKNGVQVGTVTFAAGQARPTFECDALQFVPGDYLTVQAPVSPDLTLANFALTLVGTR